LAGEAKAIVYAHIFFLIYHWKSSAFMFLYLNVPIVFSYNAVLLVVTEKNHEADSENIP